MRLKYYLRGIGIGITFATLLLTVSFYFGRDSLLKDTISDEEIIERATELGMTMPEEEISSQDKGSDKNDIETTEEPDVSLEESSEEASTEIAEEAVPTSGENATETATESSEDTSVTYIPFSVKPGQSSEVICKNLEKAGLVDSADKFNKYLNSLKVDNLVKTGTFYIQSGASYDDIVALLVNKKVRTTTPPKAQEAEQAPEKPKTPKAGE
ncbi:YceG-like family protein [Pseudobutyrivibrio sp. YE44]|uniref:endolytic transglycosylase MltG n=1 Tax=Pseudobutyrivibrio sp. YE44 TaxID=1520802 RepID=UPI000883EBE9|nr:endolytic transglycosylase MltG [Pseudobutyrivibrio sp. YE44]SDB10935.1 YceG-like family protein [Pseudobutyrivibrio sp. YE44]